MTLSTAQTSNILNKQYISGSNNVPIYIFGSFSWESWSVQACADVEHILFLVNLCPWPGPVKPPCCMCIHFLPTHILPPCRTLCTHFLPSSAHILTIACCSLPEISPKVWAQTVHSQHRKHISFSTPAQSLPVSAVKDSSYNHPQSNVGNSIKFTTWKYFRGDINILNVSSSQMYKSRCNLLILSALFRSPECSD